MVRKVLLIQSSNGHPTPPRQYPYGIAILSSLLKEKGISTTIIDGNVYPLKSLENILSQEEFDFVGISGIITSFDYQDKVAKLTKKYQPNAIIASGGGLVTSIGYDLLKLIPEIDTGFMGEGEIPLSQFLDNVESKNDLVNTNTQNVLTSQIGEIPFEKNLVINNLDDVPFPDFTGANFELYTKNPVFPLTPNLRDSKRRGSTIISRGCPFSCDYCSNVLSRRKLRRRSIDNLFEEIGILTKKYGVDYIFFNDETFPTNEGFLDKFLERYHKEAYNFRWSISTRTDRVNPEVLKKLADGNCDFIYYGFESGSQKILDAMKKRNTIENNLQAFLNTVDAGIYCAPNLIVGYDNETESTIKQTYKFVKKLESLGKRMIDHRKKMIYQQSLNNFGQIYIATPYPGTPFYERTRNKIPYNLRETLERISYKDACFLTLNVSQFSNERLQGIRDDLTNYVINIKL